MNSGTIYGVGLGPGDPELMSVKADRLIRNARHVAFFRKRGRAGHARQIVEGLLRPDVQELPMEYPVTTEIPFSNPRYNELLCAFYVKCTESLLARTQIGDDVIVLCEGDPFFYGSFMHLHARLVDRALVEVVPAITGMSAAWTATGSPIAWGDDALTVVMGTLPEAELVDRITCADAVVIMKIGRNFCKVGNALEAAGKLKDAWLIEFASMPQQRARRFSEVQQETAPYFSIVIVPGQGRRP